MSWLSGTEYLDSLVKDYLKFRGFNNSLKVLDSDLKSDKDKGFRVDKILQQLLLFISTYDLDALKSYWTNLNSKFFCRFVMSYESTIKRFETGLYRLYVVHAYQNSKQKELQSFFQKMALEVESAAEWKDWYVLPFLQSAENNPTFAPYFTRQWTETFLVSLHNLFASLFSCMPEPDLVNACIDDGERIHKLEKENESLKRTLRIVSDEHDSMTFDVPETARYVEAMGNLGSLVDKSQKVIQSKKRPIFEFVTRYSAGNTSPKDSGLTDKKMKSLVDKGNDAESSDAAKSSPKSFVSVKSKENVTSGKITKFEEERRSLLSSRKNGTANTKLNAGPLPDTVRSSSITRKTDNATISSQEINFDISNNNGSEKQQNFRETNKPNPSTDPEILYEKNIVFKPSLPQQEERPVQSGGFSSSAVSDVASSHDFVNNLHKLSLGEPFQSSNQSRDKNGNTQSMKILPTDLMSNSSTVASTYSRQSFLVLSKDVFLEHHSCILQCKFDETGTTVGSIDEQGVVKVWKNAPRISTLATIMMNSPIRCLEWCSKPIDILLLGTTNGTIRLFDTTKNISCEDILVEGPHSYITNIRAHPAGTSFTASSIKPPGTKQFISQPSDGILTVWDVRASQVLLSRKLIRDGLSEITCMEYNHNGNLLITGDSNGRVALFDMKTFSVIQSWNAHRGAVCSLQFSPDETLVFSIGMDNQILAWNLNQLPNQPSIRFSFDDHAGSASVHAGHKGSSFTLDPEGKHLLIPRGTKGSIFKINLSEETLTPVLSLPEHKSRVTTVDWTASTTCGHCLTGSSDGKIQVTTLLMQS